jgi:hypothetical protein
MKYLLVIHSFPQKHKSNFYSVAFHLRAFRITQFLQIRNATLFILLHRFLNDDGSNLPVLQQLPCYMHHPKPRRLGNRRHMPDR